MDIYRSTRGGFVVDLSVEAGDPQPAIRAASYLYDAGLIHRDFGIPTILFGPCGAGAHNPDEYIEFESVLQTAERCWLPLWTGQTNDLP